MKLRHTKPPLFRWNGGYFCTDLQEEYSAGGERGVVGDFFISFGVL